MPGRSPTSTCSEPDALVVEQAKGMIMADQNCSADEALSVLRRMAAESRRSVGYVAGVLAARAGWPGGF